MSSHETTLAFWTSPERRDDKDYFPTWSARGCAQRLEFVQFGGLRRTVNGDLVDIGGKLPHKYRTVITGQDQRPPAFEGFWQGTPLWVDCLLYLSVPLAPEAREIKLTRLPVPGSLVAQTLSGQPIEIEDVSNQEIFLGSFEEKGTLFYRPCLAMMVVSYQAKTDEWGLSTGWEIVLEEV